MSSQIEKLVVSEDQADLSKASYSASLSSTGMSEDGLEFHVTIDRVTFKNPMEIIDTVLEANGFSPNLENILACFDDLKIVANVKLGKLSNHIPTAKSFIPALQFGLPSKRKAGSLLKKFYEEIESYEIAIASLKNNSSGPATKGESAESLKTKVEKLEKENNSLKDEILSLKNLLNKAVKSEATANQALASQKILPSNIRLGVVRDINFEERMIILKSGRTTLNLPIALSTILPEVDDKCLVHMDQGATIGCFFYETKGTILRPHLAKIITIQKPACKVRDCLRRTWSLTATNESEIEIFNNMHRDEYILLYIFEGKVLRFEPLSSLKVNYADKVQEDLATFQLQKASDGQVG